MKIKRPTLVPPVPVERDPDPERFDVDTEAADQEHDDRRERLVMSKNP
jgi:hypothetical protein